LTAHIQAELFASSTQGPSPGGTTLRSTVDTHVSIETDLRTTVTTLDPDAASAIIGDIDATTAGQEPERRRSILQGALRDLGQAMSQGEGAFYYNFRAPGGGSVIGAVSRSDLAAILAGKGPDLGSINGYALRDVLRAAFSQKETAERFGAIVVSGPAAPSSRTALTLLEAARHSSDGKTATAPEPDEDAAQRIRSLVAIMAGETSRSEDRNSAALTLIYVPPAVTDSIEFSTEQSVSSETSLLLDIHA
jgi:hypothetical protein